MDCKKKGRGELPFTFFNIHMFIKTSFNMARKIKKYNVGLKSETFAISLVESPAIEEDFVALAKQEEEKVYLESDEKHIVYGAVLIPDKDIYRNSEKNGEYFINFSTESIEKMSQDFMREYRQYEIKTDHNKIADEVCVVETWLKSDLYKDKSVALGLNPNLPIGTWFAGCKVNNIETWKKIKSGELKGFSVESMLQLEEFEKQNENNMIDTNEEMFFDKIKNVFKEVLATVSLSKAEEEVKPEPIEPIAMEDLAEQTPSEPTVETPAEPTVETPKETPKEEPKPTETPKETPKEEPKPTEEPKETPKEDNHLEDLIKSLKEEVEALKEMNNGLNKKVKELSKQPSTQPVNVNAKAGVGNDNYSAWREQMRQMIG